MRKVDELFVDAGMSEVVLMRRDEYHGARFEYEMSLRRFLNDVVNSCPCCFKGFYKEAEKALTEEMLEERIEPDELSVLEAMRAKAIQIQKEHNELSDEYDVSETRH